MGILDFISGLFAGVGRKRIVPGARVIVHKDGANFYGIVLKEKKGIRRKRVLVQLVDGRKIVVRERNVTVD